MKRWMLLLLVVAPALAMARLEPFSKASLAEVGNYYRSLWPKVFEQPIKFLPYTFAGKKGSAAGTDVLAVIHDLAASAEPFFKVKAPNQPLPKATKVKLAKAAMTAVKYLSKWGVLEPADLMMLATSKSIDEATVGKLLGKSIVRIGQLTAKKIQRDY